MFTYTTFLSFSLWVSALLLSYFISLYVLLFTCKGAFNNYVGRGQDEGEGSKNVCFCPRSWYKNCPRRGGELIIHRGAFKTESLFVLFSVLPLLFPEFSTSFSYSLFVSNAATFSGPAEVGT